MKNAFDIKKIRQDFPILHQQVHGKPLVYLDNAATSQKPWAVIERVKKYYEFENANIHRGVHYLSETATQEYENSRIKIQKYLNANSFREIIFTRGTTEAINLVAQSFGRSQLMPGDEVLITQMEHHSNIVPWQMICDERDAKLVVAPITDEGELILEEFEKRLTDKTKIVAIVHISNSLGTINPVEKVIAMAHARGIPVLLDGAQAMPHHRVDVQKLDVDFYAFSGHKLFGPTGIGVLYGKEKWLDLIPPYQGGGDMIRQVSFEKTTYNDLPYKFEAGTPNIAGSIGLGAAVDYLETLNFEEVQAYEQSLLHYATERVREIPGLHIIGEARHKASVISMTLDHAHAHDIGTILDQEGIAIRTGHHCTMPLMKRLGLAATSRASFAFYNTKEEADILVEALKKVQNIFR